MPNRTTVLLKDAILQAATQAGDGDLVAYLEVQARSNPGPFMALLGKVLPLVLHGSIDVTHKQAVEHAAQRFTSSLAGLAERAEAERDSRRTRQ